MVREVTGISEDLGGNYSVEAKFDSKECSHGTEYASVSKKDKIMNSRSKVGVIIIPGTKATKCLSCRVLCQCLIGQDIFRDKRNRQQQVHTLAYGISKIKIKVW